MNESTMLIAKTSVPTKRTTALSHSMRRGSAPTSAIARDEAVVPTSRGR